MKRLLLTLGFLTAFCATEPAFSQSSTPEFQLPLTFAEGNATLSGRAFGYDPAATDSFDAAYNEDYDYPGSTGFIPDFYFEYPYPTFEHLDSRVQIREKPATDAFVLQFTMNLSLTDIPATLSWNPEVIPNQIRAILVTPSGNDSKVLVDLKKQSSVVLTDFNQQFDWQKTHVTIYYNTDPQLAVVENATPQSSLIANLSSYPNPMLTTGHLRFDLSKAASVSVQVFDVAGRKCSEEVISGRQGLNLLDIPATSGYNGAMLVQIEAVTGEASESKSILVVKQ